MVPQKNNNNKGATSLINSITKTNPRPTYTCN